jgi:UDP-N-acetylmuramoyl-tripeptide--D-alanyl-D-alanine ligase
MFELDGPESHLPHQLEVHTLTQDIIVIDDTQTISANEAVTSLKRVTMAARGERRVVVVAGPVDFSGDSDYDNLQAFAAVMVRLNVSQVFAVGPQARAIAVSVGLEGSWDGESHHCPDVDQAYDEVRAFIRPGDVVLIMGTTSDSLYPILQSLMEEFG